MNRRLEVIASHVKPERVEMCCASKEAEVLRMERDRMGGVLSHTMLENWLDGGVENVALKHECMRVVEEDKVLDSSSLVQFEMSIEERRFQSTQRLLRFSELIQGKTEQYELNLIRAVSLVDTSTTIRWFVQKLLWTDTIRNQGTPEQIERWTAGALEYRIVGCFAMTELGHSSALRNLETTSNYDEKTQEFIINSPTVTSTKFWIGQAGQIATHSIVLANTWSLGKPLGVQLFIVPIRDPKTGKPLPGIDVGDLGPKYGLDGNDNGFIRFSNVRIPRDQMLARWSQVSADGTWVAPPLAQLAYGSTIAERLTSYYWTDRAVMTVCIRFCLQRTQGFSKPEPSIIDYATHFVKLMPYLALMYVRSGFGRTLHGRYLAMVGKLRAGDEASYLAGLPELHALACAAKSFGSWTAMDMFECCRRAMGGHAFHSFGSVSRALADSAVGTTGGGDNNVIVQQTAAYLLKQHRNPTALSTAFLKEKDRLIKGPIKFASFQEATEKSDLILELFKAHAIAQIESASQQLGAGLMRGQPHQKAWNAALLSLIRSVEAYYWLTLLDLGREAMKEASEGPLHDCILTMWTLVAVWRIEASFADFSQSMLVDFRDINAFRQLVQDGSAQVRKYAAILVDAFAIPDSLLRAPLANADGSAYEAYLAAVKGARVNQTGGTWPHWQHFFKDRQVEH